MKAWDLIKCFRQFIRREDNEKNSKYLEFLPTKTYRGQGELAKKLQKQENQENEKKMERVLRQNG